MISVRNLSVYFGAVRALDDITIHFPRNGVVCLQGENGSGKSTLLDVLAGFCHPNSGEVLEDGGKQSMPARNLLMLSARLHQATVLPLELGIKEYLSIVSDPSAGRWILTSDRRTEPKAESLQISQAVVDLLLARGVDASNSIRLCELSWGQQRLVALSAVVLARKRMLLLDEPFAGLASDARNAATTLISTEARSRLVVVADHDLSAMRRIGDVFITLQAGRVSAIRSKEQLGTDMLSEGVDG